MFKFLIITIDVNLSFSIYNLCILQIKILINNNNNNKTRYLIVNEIAS